LTTPKKRCGTNDLNCPFSRSKKVILLEVFRLGLFVVLELGSKALTSVALAIRSVPSAFLNLMVRMSPSAIGKPAYDKLLVYKKRFQDGKLGRRAIDKILSEYGFNKHETIFYTKEEK